MLLILRVLGRNLKACVDILVGAGTVGSQMGVVHSRDYILLDHSLSGRIEDLQSDTGVVERMYWYECS